MHVFSFVRGAVVEIFGRRGRCVRWRLIVVRRRRITLLLIH